VIIVYEVLNLDIFLTRFTLQGIYYPVWITSMMYGCTFWNFKNWHFNAIT